MATKALPIALFGYHSSLFTQKIRMALKIRQIPYTFVLVPSMLPRPIFLDYFNLTYRKIPVLATGKDLYADTSLIIEAVQTLPSFENTEEHPPLHADAKSRSLARIFASHYTDRPLFRLMTGVVPGIVWRTHFGIDRADLIGHKLDPDKLERKIPRNIAILDTYLSILEPLVANQPGWLLGTEKPSAADLNLYTQLDWGEKISRGEGVEDLTGGEARDEDGAGEGIGMIFNEKRYPGLFQWFLRFKSYLDGLPNIEKQVVAKDDAGGIETIMDELRLADQTKSPPLISTPNVSPPPMDERINLVPGIKVSVTPDDTGRNEPTFGTLLATSSEEVVIEPSVLDGQKAKVAGIRVHFPRVGFVVVPAK